MVPANKILTVAYGTFSCTLEGFDDPFSTMTDIAEYFRDLAADDRFFGAEPPTPDMAMLRTIAESRARRSVDARPEEGGIVLRPASVPDPAAMSAAFDTRAAELAKAAPSPAPGTPAASDASGDEPGDPVAEVTAPEVDHAAGDVEDDAPAIADAEAPRPEDDNLVEDMTERLAEAAAERIASPADDSVAAKLARIRDVVEADRQAASIYAEDQHADDEIIEDDGVMADDTLAAAFAADAIEDTADGDDPATDAAETGLAEEDPAPQPAVEEARSDAPAEDAPAAAREDTLADELAAILPTETEDETDEAETSARADDTRPEDVDGGSEVEAASEPRRIRVRKIRLARPEEAVAVTTDDVATEAPDPDAAMVDDGTAEMPTAEDEDDELMAELAAIETGLDREATDDIGEDAPTDGILSLDDDEHELMAELATIRADEIEEADDDMSETAAVTGSESAEDAAEEEDIAAVLSEAETAADEPPEDVQSEEAEPASDEEEGEDSATGEAGAALSAPDMERLFAATDSRLSGEDTSRRHANISHLKAAVAARRADGPIETREDDDTGAYRADLANTVRPRRAIRPADERAERPGRPDRPAPLVLVSEQRVQDEISGGASAPVQPRRASRLSEAETQEEAQLRQGAGKAATEDFEQFAADVGAVDLPEILEAAAVYSAKVMGQDSFSRPRLLHLAAEACDDLSREDGLRGFGQLLRDGTIRKVSRGTFALASDSRYASDAERRVG